MHILFVVGTFPDLTFVLRTIAALAEDGHRITVMARRKGDWVGFKAELPLPEGLSIRYQIPDIDLTNPKRLLRFVFGVLSALVRHPRETLRILQLFRTNQDTRYASWRGCVRYLSFVGLRPDVIQFEFPMTAEIYGLLPDILQAPTVVSCRGSDFHLLHSRTPSEREARIRAVLNATAVHAVSEELAGVVQEVTGRSNGVWINRPAVKLERIQAKTSYSLSDVPKIITVGRLMWIKGYDYLLAALARLHAEGYDFRAEIIGAGELYSVLRFSIDDLGLGNCVTLTGKLPSAEVFDRLHAADLFVLSSHEEGISNAVLEAMACGLPIVTTNAGGMAEAVRDGMDGFVVPVRDITALKDGIARLLVDAKLREQMGRSARTRVQTEFSLERQVRIFDEIYHSITDETHAK